MGVQKFRSFQGARRALWLPSGHPDVFDRLRRPGELARVPPRAGGVRRFRSLVEAEATKRS